MFSISNQEDFLTLAFAIYVAQNSCKREFYRPVAFNAKSLENKTNNTRAINSLTHTDLRVLMVKAR
jgi:hypothetical protein